MPSITSNGTVIVRVSAGLYGLAPGNAIYSELVNASYSGGVNALVNNLYSSDFGAQTTGDASEQVRNTRTHELESRVASALQRARAHRHARARVSQSALSL